MATDNKVSDYVNSVEGWRGDMLKELRELINTNAPDMTEALKWGVPVWSSKKMVCAISAFKSHVKINFFKGAFLPDPDKLFNNGFDSKEHRSVDFTEGDETDEAKLSELIKAAASYDK